MLSTILQRWKMCLFFFLLGHFKSSYNSRLSFKQNILGYFVDCLKLFPDIPYEPTLTNDQLIESHTRIWKRTGNLALKMQSVAVEFVKKDQISSRDGKTMLEIKIIRPKGVKSHDDELLPICVYLHGGGFMFGDVDFYEDVLRWIANVSKVVVIGVNYRLAPSVKFPIPMYDCEDVIQFVHRESAQMREKYGADSTRIHLAGDSAGGNLAAVVSVSLKERIKLKSTVLIYPCTSAYNIRFWLPPPHIVCSTDSLVVNAVNPTLKLSAMSWFWDNYLESKDQATNPFASPVLFNEDQLRGINHTYVMVAECDVLRDEGLAYAELLKRAGKLKGTFVAKDSFHGFINLANVGKHQQAMEFIRDAIWREEGKI